MAASHCVPQMGGTPINEQPLPGTWLERSQVKGLRAQIAGPTVRVAFLMACEGSYVVADVQQATKYVLTKESQYAKLVNNGPAMFKPSS